VGVGDCSNLDFELAGGIPLDHIKSIDLFFKTYYPLRKGPMASASGHFEHGAVGV